ALVRQRSWRTPGTGDSPPESPSLPVLVAALGGRALVELLVLDGELHALVAAGGRIRHRPLGAFPPVAAEVAALRVALRRLVLRHGTAASVEAARTAVEYGATALDRLLLAPLDDLLGDRPLVLAPTGPLHALPWSMLPRCGARPVCV